MGHIDCHVTFALQILGIHQSLRKSENSPLNASYVSCIARAMYAYVHSTQLWVCAFIT